MSFPVPVTGFLLELRSRVSDVGCCEVVRRMGYRNASEAAIRRLGNALDDPLLGLDSGAYDFRFTSTEFVRALCLAVDIAPTQVAEEIGRIKNVVRSRERAFRPFLFVDTGFVRGAEPIAVLALAESRRRIFFDRAFRDFDLNAQIGIAQIRARDHCRENEGHLPIWGSIRQYEFHYSDGQMYLIGCDGSLIKATSARVHSHTVGDIAGVFSRVYVADVVRGNW